MQQEGGADGKFPNHAADQVAEGAEHRMEGSAVGQVFCHILRPCHVDHIGQHADEHAADEHACQKPHKENARLGGGIGEPQLRQRVADAADEQGLPGGNEPVNIAPGGGQGKIGDHHDRQHQPEHIVRQTQLLNDGGRYGVREIGRKVEQRHGHEKQKKAGFIFHKYGPNRSFQRDGHFIAVGFACGQVDHVRLLGEVLHEGAVRRETHPRLNADVGGVGFGRVP